MLDATGVILHTNLGRRRWRSGRRAGRRRRRRLLELELDLRRAAAAAARASRAAAPRADWSRGGAASETAAAARLALALPGRDRGGGLARRAHRDRDGFRIPEVLRPLGTLLREVGTTNRTRPSDYEAALGAETGPFSASTRRLPILGFTASVPLERLCALAAEPRSPSSTTSARAPCSTFSAGRGAAGRPFDRGRRRRCLLLGRQAPRWAPGGGHRRAYGRRWRPAAGTRSHVR